MKKRIRLTESDLHNMVKESLKKILMEDSNFDRVFSYIDKPHKVNIEKYLIPIDHEVYNNENLINKPNLLYWLEYASDAFAGVTKDGEVYTDYFPNISIGNIYRDKYYLTMVNGAKDSFLGEEGCIFIHPDNTCTVCCGYTIYNGKLLETKNGKYVVYGSCITTDWNKKNIFIDTSRSHMPRNTYQTSEFENRPPQNSREKRIAKRRERFLSQGKLDDLINYKSPTISNISNNDDTSFDLD